MKIGTKRLVVLATIFGLTFGMPVLAGGDKNAKQNPNGAPDDPAFSAPFANFGEGRMLVFCDDNEELVMVPTKDGAVELICMPAEE